MNRNLILMVLLTSSTFVLADLAPRDSFMITQPDSTTLWLFERGDEYFHWEESTDGYVIIPNAQGVMEYASANGNTMKASGIKVHNTKAKSGTEKNFAKQQEQAVRTALKVSLEETLAKRSEHQNRITIPTTPVIGTRKILTVLVGFSNYPFTYTQANFDSLMNYVGYSGHGNAGSVRDYYYENSYQQLTLQSTVIGPFVAAHDTAYYRRPRGGILGGHSQELVREAIEYAKTQNIDFSTFDGNNDGKVDCIHIVYAGNRHQAGGPGFIWPYHSNYDTTFVQNSHQIIIADFIMTPEKLEYTFPEMTSIGTICHEIGHVLGAPDFYPTGNYLGYAYQLGTGVWDVMAIGNQALYMGYYPAHHNPYTKTAIFKWNKQRTIGSTVEDSLYNIATSSQDSTAIYKIPTATTEEYYLLENRQKVSFDSYLPDRGLLIYHIHSGIEAAITTNSVNSSLPQKCYLADPSSSQALPTNVSSYGQNMRNIFPISILFDDTVTNNFFTSQTTPSSCSWAGAPTGIDICFIQHNGNNMKFVVNPQIEGPDTLHLHGVPDSAWYYIRNVPSGATITWNVTNTFPRVRFVLVSPQGRDSMYVAYRGTPLVSPPVIENINNDIEVFRPPFYHRETLSVSINYGTASYTATKQINMRVEQNSATNAPQYSMNSSTMGENIEVEISTSGDAFAVSCYSLELWSPIYGLMRTKVVQSATEQMDISGLPQGVYILLLKANGTPVAETKVLIQ